MKQYYLNSTRTHFLSISANRSHEVTFTDFELSFIEAAIKDSDTLKKFKEMKKSMSLLAGDKDYRLFSDFYPVERYKRLERGIYKKTYILMNVPLIREISVEHLQESTYTKILSLDKIERLKKFSALAHDFLKDFKFEAHQVEFVYANNYWDKTHSSSQTINFADILKQFKTFLDYFDKNCDKVLGKTLKIDYAQYKLQNHEIVQHYSDYQDGTPVFYLIAKTHKGEEGFVTMDETSHGETLYRYGITKHIRKATVFQEVPRNLPYEKYVKFHLRLSYDCVDNSDIAFAQEVSSNLQKSQLESVVAVSHVKKTHKL